MLNKQNIYMLADVLDDAALPIGFNMALWACNKVDEGIDDKTGHNCNTVACVAGWAVALFENKSSAALLSHLDFEDKTYDARAAEYLGVEGNQTYELFIPMMVDWNKIDNHVAAKTLRHLAETGVVDYKRFIDS